MNDLYETDILAWSEDQAARLRRLAATERANDLAPDWPNIIEEIEDVGRSSLRAVRSLLTQALVHMLKAEAWPPSPATPGWQAEARLFRREARDEFTPSMRQRIDLAKLYANALAGLPEMIDGHSPLSVPTECPFTLDELLTEP